MLKRLLEANYLQNRADATPERQQFWLRELRTPELLAEVTQTWPEIARRIAAERPLLALAQSGKLAELETALAQEERKERELDQSYWKPLKAELEQLRHPGKKR